MKRILVIIISLLIAVSLGARRCSSRRKTFSLHTPLKQKRYKQAYFVKCYKVNKLKKRLKKLEKLKKKIQDIPRDDKQLEIEQPPSVDIVEQYYESPDIEKQTVSEQDNPEQDNPEQDTLGAEDTMMQVAIETDKSSSLLTEPDMLSMQPVQYQPQVTNYPTQDMQQPQMPLPVYYQAQQAPMIMPQQQAPIMQPMYPQNQNQLAAVAMQMQASAMAMQAQASALMMQAQQQQPTFSYGPVMQPSTRELTKQEKFNQCMHCLRQVVNSGDDAVQRVLLLIDLEFDILEHLLAGNTGQVVDRAVQERNATIKNSPPLTIAGYDKVLDLATVYGSDDTGARLYHYCVRKSKRAKQATTSQGKKKFLMRVMYELEKYYAMLEKMQRDLAR